MRTQYLGKRFDNRPANESHDRWIKDERVKSIKASVVRMVVAKVLADLAVQPDSLAVGRPGRVARVWIDGKSIEEFSSSSGYFHVCVLRELNSIRGVKRTSIAGLRTDRNKGEHMLFTYGP